MGALLPPGLPHLLAFPLAPALFDHHFCPPPATRLYPVPAPHAQLYAVCPCRSPLYPRYVCVAAGLYVQPHDDVRHALVCGLLPTLERMVREAPAAVAARGEAEEGTAAELLAACYFGRNDWERLMPYATPQQLGGLVAAAGGVLGRRVEAMEEQQGWVRVGRGGRRWPRVRGCAWKLGMDVGGQGVRVKLEKPCEASGKHGNAGACTKRASELTRGAR